jgi:hypothetical protein
MHESLRAANEAMILCEHAWNNEIDWPYQNRLNA